MRWIPTKAGRPGDAVAWRATLAGLCASLVGIGLARFAYTPLIPALIAAGWFDPAQTAYLGAANLAGYLAGAWAAHRAARWIGVTTLLRAMLLLAALSFLACAVPLSFAWFFVWRVAAGLAGGALMVLAAPAVLPHVPQVRRGLVGGAIFTGVGLGIVASGTLVPLLLGIGLTETWIGLGVLALALTSLGWFGWPRQSPAAVASPPPARSGTALKALYLEYGLNAAGLVPHMVFLVDFIARGLDRGVAVGARYWVLFGLGAVAGPLLAGWAADRIGFRAALRAAFLIQTVAVGLVAVADGTFALMLSSAVVGAFVPGVVPLALGRVHELVRDEGSRRAAWSRCTIAFAIGQAGAAYGFSALFAATGAFPILFAVAAAALALALAVDLAVRVEDKGALS